MRFIPFSKMRMLVTLAIYPILYYGWANQIKNSWVTLTPNRSKTISSTVTQISSTLRGIGTNHTLLPSQLTVNIKSAYFCQLIQEIKNNDLTKMSIICIISSHK